MKVLVTGATGQLGQALLNAAPASVEVRGVNRSECDLEQPARCRELIASELPAVVINAAAYTQVDKAEGERERAFRINAEGPAALAEALARSGGRLIQISTDFVFDGALSSPYSPDAE